MAYEFRKKIRREFYKIISAKGSEHSIALGFAIGSFIAILPSFGLDILIGLLIVLIFKRINKFSLFGSFVVWNPLTLFPIYFLSYQLGSVIFGSTPAIRFNVVMVDMIYNFSARFFAGTFILSLLISVTSYFVIRISVNRYKRRVIRLLKKKEKERQKNI